MINIMDEKQKVQAIVEPAKVVQTLDDRGIYYTIVHTRSLNLKEELALSLLFRKRTMHRQILAVHKYVISTSYT